MAVKHYDLDIENVGSNTYIIMSKGHHDIHEFMRKARDEGYDWPLGVPKHVWVKTTPDKTGEFSFKYNIVPADTRGAFPATYAWEAYGDQSYGAVHGINGNL